VESAEFNITKYDYELPPECIAQRPAEPRDSSRLMVLERASGEIRHSVFSNIGEFLRPDDLLVLNNTRVFPARTLGTRSTGGKIEVFFLQDLGRDGLWEVLLKCNGKPKHGEYIELEGGLLKVKIAQRLESGHWTVVVPRGTDLIETLERIGRTPLPPYIHRPKEGEQEDFDRQRYQTVYAKAPGAVAAPTAGLHFTPGLLIRLRERGVRTTEVTLHVGAGTFQPVKEYDIRRHKMHEEFYSISDETIEAVRETRGRGGRIIPVGTTSCRTLEGAMKASGELTAGSGRTDIYIYPPYAFRLTDAMITNFHLPRSSLLLLVAAFAGRERILGAYEEAKREGYRFYSYGDAMLIL
jgi:S-adenosylmethionine:tRNA ribosyltransferase-isomerase